MNTIVDMQALQPDIDIYSLAISNKSSAPPTRTNVHGSLLSMLHETMQLVLRNRFGANALKLSQPSMTDGKLDTPMRSDRALLFLGYLFFHSPVFWL
jgi:hypothetical protein